MSDIRLNFTHIPHVPELCDRTERQWSNGASANFPSVHIIVIIFLQSSLRTICAREWSEDVNENVKLNDEKRKYHLYTWKVSTERNN